MIYTEVTEQFYNIKEALMVSEVTFEKFLGEEAGTPQGRTLMVVNRISTAAGLIASVVGFDEPKENTEVFNQAVEDFLQSVLDSDLQQDFLKVDLDAETPNWSSKYGDSLFSGDFSRNVNLSTTKEVFTSLASQTGIMYSEFNSESREGAITLAEDQNFFELDFTELNKTKGIKATAFQFDAVKQEKL